MAYPIDRKFVIGVASSARFRFVGISEAKLQSAWRNQTHQEIAASIVGYIRQAALGEVLLPFDQRVGLAMQKIYVLHNWTPAQRMARASRQTTEP